MSSLSLSPAPRALHAETIPPSPGNSRAPSLLNSQTPNSSGSAISPQGTKMILATARLIQSASGTQVRAGILRSYEKKLFLSWLAENVNNYSELKTNGNSTFKKISREVFDRSRTPESVKAMWESMKRKYQDARDRLQSTGEGQSESDGDKWRSITLSWLDKMFPHIEEIDDILKRHRSITPLFVSEAGGDDTVRFIDGELDDKLEEIHPSAGGQKLPRRKGEIAGTGPKGLKNQSSTVMEDAIDALQEKRMKFEEDRLAYEKERDERNLQFLKDKEANRHAESLIRLRTVENKMELPVAKCSKENS